MTGIVAAMLEKNPNFKSSEIKKVLQLSGSLSSSPNNFVGFGFPDCEKIVKQLESKGLVLKQMERKKARKSIVIKTAQKEGIKIFHKKDERNVIFQEVLQASDGRLEIKKSENVKQTTVTLNDRIVEILWKN